MAYRSHFNEGGAMTALPPLLDAAGRRRPPATMPGYHAGRSPHNQGMRYPADPPRVEEIVAVMRQAGDSPYGLRIRGLIVVLWRAGLRIHEALMLTETDLDLRQGSMLVRHGKGGKRREVGLDDLGLAASPRLAARPSPAACSARNSQRRSFLTDDRTEREDRPPAGRRARPRGRSPGGMHNRPLVGPIMLAC
jgi:integrase